MKKLMLMISMLCCIYMSKSQVIVDGDDINKTGAKYCQIVGTQKMLSNKVTIAIDYGQDRKYFSPESKIEGPDGKSRIFNSMIDVLNFMENNGWTFVNAYLLSEGNQKIYHFLLKRKE